MILEPLEWIKEIKANKFMSDEHACSHSTLGYLWDAIGVTMPNSWNMLSGTLAATVGFFNFFFLLAGKGVDMVLFGHANRRIFGGDVGKNAQSSLRYHVRWIDSVWKSRSYTDALKENPINLYIFWKLNSYRMQSYLWYFIQNFRRSVIKRNIQKHCFA